MNMGFRVPTVAKFLGRIWYIFAELTPEVRMERLNKEIAQAQASYLNASPEEEERAKKIWPLSWTKGTSLQDLWVHLAFDR